jgi:hypothetical protein
MFDGEFQKEVAALKSQLLGDVGPMTVTRAVVDV